MGWDLVDTGLNVVFGAQIPRYVVELFCPEVELLLSRHKLTVPDVAHLVLHPGGAKVLSAYEKALALPPGRLTAARDVMRQYGNMSSVTVLFVLDKILREGQPKPGEYGLMAALGPGFSAEQMLIRF